MIINDEPSLILRRCVEALKMILSSLHNMSSCSIRYVTIMGVALFVIIGVLSADTVVHAQEEKEIADQDLQLYTACLLSKDLDGESAEGIDVFALDQECHDRSLQGKIVEDENDIFAASLSDMLEDHPMVVMADAIALQDRTVAGLIVGIARQESQWGVHAPSKDGIDCYNYWGYKSSGTRGQSLGYACFGSPEEAVEVIGERLHHFVYDTNRDTPAKVVTPWKCGNSCATHSSESVARWVGTVTLYFDQVVALGDDAENLYEKQNTLLTMK